MIRGGHRGTRNGIWGRHSKDKEGGSGVDSGGKGIRGGHRGTRRGISGGHKGWHKTGLGRV